MNFGPQHPAAHGVLRLVLEMDGEVVQSADPHIGLLHRGTEKLAESKPFNQSIGYMDRLDYVSMMCNEHAYVRAIENAARHRGADARAVDPHDVRRDHAHPESPDVDRLERARPRRDGGVPVRVPRARRTDGLLRGGLRRAHARDLLPSGRRLPRPAGRDAEVPAIAVAQGQGRSSASTMARRARCWISSRHSRDDFPQGVDEYEDAAHRQPHLEAAHRRHRRGHARAGAWRWGITGPMLRGSGIEWDLRKKQPYASYAEMDFDIPVGVNGDCYDRYLVRVEEMRQSNRIIQQCVEWLRANPGPVMVDDHKVAPPSREEMKDDMESLIHHFKLFTEGYCVPAGETYAAVEAPKGEFGCYLVSDGANKPFRAELPRAGLRAPVVAGRDRARATCSPTWSR